MVIDRPIFIIGCGRSGTTLLFNLLEKHPKLIPTTGYPDGEDHEGWIEHGSCVMAGLGNVNSEKYANGINGYNFCLHMTEENADEEIITSMRTHYWNNVLNKNINMRVINKQPHLSNKVSYLLKIFPDAKIIHIIRDCEPVVASFIAVMREHPSLMVYLPEEEYPCFWVFVQPESQTMKNVLAKHRRFYPGGGEKLFVDYWCKINSGIETQMNGNLKQLCVVRYEDLIDNPSHVLSLICKFCELDQYDFNVKHISKNTKNKYAHLISQDIKQYIKDKATAHLQYFGYKRSLFKHRTSSRIYA